MTHARKLVHTSRMPIRWGDMDALGHVNNTVYFRYMEQARLEWLYAYVERHGGVYAGQIPVIINASCTFLAPLVYPGELEVRMFLGEAGRTSVGSHYEIWMTQTKYADGAAKIVWVDRKTMRPVPLPETLKSILAGVQ